MVQVATDEAEGAQALFCYIADSLGAKQTTTAYKPYLSGSKNADDFFAKYKTLVDKAFSSRAVDTGKSKQQKIKLTKSEVAIADKLGVSYEQYARQKQRLQTS